MRLIPGKTKVQIEFFKGVSIWDIILGAIGLALAVAVLLSSLPHRFYILIGVVVIFAGLLIRLDTTPNYVYLLHILRHFSYKRYFERTLDDDALLVMNDQKDHEELVDELFEGAEKKKKRKAQEEKTDTRKKERKKAEAALYREESKKLRDKKVSEEEKNEIWKARAARSAAKKRERTQEKDEHREFHPMEDVIPFTEIKNNLIYYGGKYYGAVIEILPVEFRFFSKHRRNNSIEAGVGKILRNLNPDYSANIVKIDRPINYDRYLDKEYDKLDELRHSYESGLLNEQELQARVEVLYDRINELQTLCKGDPVIAPYYYLVLFESDRRQLELQVNNALDALQYGEIEAYRLKDKEIAVFLKYTNEIDFDERMVEQIRPEDYAIYAMPQSVEIKPRTVEINNIMTHNFRINAYPTMVDDAWLATVMSMPATKVVVKCKPMERFKAMKLIDRSLGELRGQLMATGLDSKAMELQEHIETLSELLATLQQENENLLQVNIYVTAYDIAATRDNPKIKQPPISRRSSYGGMKKAIRRLYQEHGFRLVNQEFDQMQGFIGSQISGWDPLPKEARGIPSNSVAASYPWVFANVSDEGGFRLGSSEGVPVFINFFRRDRERINSNLVIVGKSGSGKSYATKDILTNLAAEDAKIFILDPENEYSELAENLHGKFINVGNAQQGRINPFHIITALDDESDSSTVTGSYATHLQFLEEFFRQILPDCDKDALEYLNNLVDRMYTNAGITAETDLSKLRPEDYPIFDDLYDAVLAEFQQTDNEYIRTILRSLMNYIAKFSTGGRNANIWNGPSTITTEENFTVFNFQSLLANRNGTIANAQMLLVLKYIDNEIIKNRDFNLRYGLNRKVVVAIDEAHVFIDTKFPIALDFMFQLAKRIRKYNGMQIVITQNIKDFVGSEDIERKSTAIINACQYSLIFSLAPNDMQDLCMLYEKAGGINEMEQEKILTAPRGQAFTVMGPTSRSTFRVEVPEPIVDMFQNPAYQSRYFTGEGGAENWEAFVADSRPFWEENRPKKIETAPETVSEKKHVHFVELTDDEAEDMKTAAVEIRKKPTVLFEEIEEPVETSVQQPEPKAEPVVQAAPAPEIEPVVQQPTPGIQPVVQQPAPGIEPVVQPQQPTELEKLLTQALGQFSHATMLEEIKKTVREELLKEMQELKPELERMRTHNKAEEEEFTENDFEEEEITEEDFTENNFEEEETEEDFTEETEEDVAEEDFEEEGFTEEDVSEDNFEEETSTSETEEESEEDLSWLYGDDDDEEEDETGETEGTEEDETGSVEISEEEGADMDIMDILFQQVDEMENVNAIDMMDIYDEQVIDISLEELASYIQKNR